MGAQHWRRGCCWSGMNTGAATKGDLIWLDAFKVLVVAVVVQRQRKYHNKPWTGKSITSQSLHACKHNQSLPARTGECWHTLLLMLGRQAESGEQVLVFPPPALVLCIKRVGHRYQRQHLNLYNGRRSALERLQGENLKGLLPALASVS